MPAADKSRFREGGARKIAPQHQSRGAGNIRLKCQDHKVVHDLEMHVLALGYTERHFRGNLGSRIIGCSPDPTFYLTDISQVVIESSLITLSEIFLETRNFVSDRVQNTGTLQTSRAPLLGTQAIAKHALESNSGINFRW